MLHEWRWYKVQTRRYILYATIRLANTYHIYLIQTTYIDLQRIYSFQSHSYKIYFRVHKKADR